MGRKLRALGQLKTAKPRSNAHFHFSWHVLHDGRALMRQLTALQNGLSNFCVKLLDHARDIEAEGFVRPAENGDCRLQTYVSYLLMIGVCTPLIGLFGTVTDVMSRLRRPAPQPSMRPRH